MAKQRGLGKGLSVLIPTETVLKEEQHEEKKEISKQSTSSLECDLLTANPFQPRRDIKDSELNDLASSIKEHGVIQPILVRKKENSWEIVAGERRWKAAQLAGLKEIPVREMELSDSQVMELALVENLQREDLSSMEIAYGIQELINKLALTHEEAAKKIGISRAAVTNKLRLLQLPKEVISMMESGAISEGHARTLLTVPTIEKMIELAELTDSKGLNVRQLEEYVRRLPLTEKIEAAFPKKPLAQSEFEEEIAMLNTNYNLNIKIAGNKKNMGLIIKGLKRWQVQRLLEYIEDHNEELFPRE